MIYSYSFTCSYRISLGYATNRVKVALAGNDTMLLSWHSHVVLCALDLDMIGLTVIIDYKHLT